MKRMKWIPTFVGMTLVLILSLSAMGQEQPSMFLFSMGVSDLTSKTTPLTLDYRQGLAVKITDNLQWFTSNAYNATELDTTKQHSFDLLTGGAYNVVGIKSLRVRLGLLAQLGATFEQIDPSVTWQTALARVFGGYASWTINEKTQAKLILSGHRLWSDNYDKWGVYLSAGFSLVTSSK